MYINWKIRLQSYPFWTALFALIGFLLVQFGLWNIGDYQTLVELLLVVLVTGGIITDPTTAGVNDSKQVLEYTKARKDIE
ncbi:phage holin [Jeotgalibacillus marinus]|uniref:Phage holin n=1 Tax=Jeotgalibacillus marinus TaxID=86667 RepID=A0ABV3Q7X6_9BACL